MASFSSPAFDRLSRSIQVRDLQRPFAMEWDLDKNGSSEVQLLRSLIEKRGVLERNPVLLTAKWRSDAPMLEGMGMPCGIYYPALALQAAFSDGELDEDSLIDEGGWAAGLDSGSTSRVVDLWPFNIVSGDTSLLDLIKSPPGQLDRGVLVLDGKHWTGAIKADDLMSPAGRMCFLSLVLHLESSATDLCRLFPTECVLSLSKGRMAAALAAFTKRMGKSTGHYASSLQRFRLYLDQANGEADAVLAPHFALLIDSTYLVDKGQMLCKCKLTIDISNTKMKHVFAGAETLRNRCAHPGADSEELPMPFEKLRELVTEIVELTGVLEESFERECKGRGIGPRVGQ